MAQIELPDELSDRAIWRVSGKPIEIVKLAIRKSTGSQRLPVCNEHRFVKPAIHKKHRFTKLAIRNKHRFTTKDTQNEQADYFGLTRFVKHFNLQFKFALIARLFDWERIREADVRSSECLTIAQMS